MNKAYVYFDDKNMNNFSGEGPYVLVFNDEVIASHFCSNRSFANHDLTVWKLEALEKYKIDEVISNSVVVWEKENEEINNKTQAEFEVANDIYEAKYCQ